MRRMLLLWPLAASLTAGQAQAHAFKSGADYYGQFVEGTGVILTYPSLLLPTLAVGLLVGLWRGDGLPQVWPYFLAGLLGGVILGAYVGPSVALALMVLGVTSATCAALLPSHLRTVIAAFAGLTGLLLSAASFEGHGLFELGFFIHLGILFGANVVLAATAALAAIALEKVEAMWMRIALRIAASWIAAMLILMLAFELAK